jgi:tetratricopeptide (TPR) repeat protein
MLDLSKIRRTTLVIALAATTVLAAPATRPAGRETAQVLVEQGSAALQAQDKQASLDAYLDAYQLIRLDRQIPATDPLRVQTMHGLAIAYFQAGRVDKAGEVFKTNDTLDKVLAAPATAPRSLVVNRAVLDLTQKFNIMRAIKTTKDYLAAHPNESDEVLVNLLGTALDEASDERFATTPLFLEAQKFYDQQSARLEESRRGEKRWGVEWVSQAEFDDRTADRKRLLDTLAEAKSKLVEARRELAQAEQEVSQESAKRKMGKANDYNSAVGRRNNAAGEAAVADRAVTEARKAIPKLPWLTTFQPVLPQEQGEAIALAPVPPPPANKQPPTRSPGAVQPPDPVKPKNPDPVDPPAQPDPPVANNDPAPVPEQPPKPVEPPKAVRVTRYATAFPVGPDLLITSAAAVDRAGSVKLEDAFGNLFDADVVRADTASGLALLRVQGKTFAYLNLAAQYAGGTDLKCTGFPQVSIFSPVPEQIVGKSGPIKAGETGSWSISLATNPRLGGSPVVTGKGELIGVAMAQRDSTPAQIPTIRLDAIKTFLGEDAPKSASANPDPKFIMLVTATVRN